MEDIVSDLGALPLALAQAGAYMLDTARDFFEYRKRLTENPTRTLGESFKSYKDGVLSCFEMSAKYLTEKNPDAMKLLRLLSFLSEDGVPDELLERGIKGIPWTEKGEGSHDDVTIFGADG